MKKKKNSSADPGSETAGRNTTARRRFLPVLLLTGFSLAVVILTRPYYSYNPVSLSNFRTGEAAPADFVLDHDLTYVDDAATAERRRVMESLVPLVFYLDDAVTRGVMEDLQEFTGIMESSSAIATRAYALYVLNDYPGLLPAEDIMALIDASPPDFFRLLDTALYTIMENGIFMIPSSIDQSEDRIVEVKVRREGKDMMVNTLLSEVTTINDVAKLASRNFSLEGDSKRIGTAVIRYFTRENVFYDSEETEKRLKNNIRGIDEVKYTYYEGERIVQEGEIVTEDIRKTIEIYRTMMVRRTLLQLAGSLIFLAAVMLFALLTARYLMNTRPLKSREIAFLTVLSAFYMLIAGLALLWDSFPVWMPISLLLPNALIALLVTVILDVRFGVILNACLSMMILLVWRNDFTAFVFALMSGTAASISIADAERRIDLIRSSLYMIAGNAGAGLLIAALGNLQVSRIFFLMFWAAVHAAVTGILNMYLLSFIEHLLNAPTSFRLNELSDLNTTIFKRMITNAPGTYGHSISVANLAERACREIGANALLARVAAYYHDIGKIEQPQYFIENQNDSNKHDELKPGMSVAIIKSHLKIGIEKAKEINLPEEVIDIIAQHHGDGLIQYFYNQAARNEGEKILQEDFSYPGPAPSSREAAVVMLADTTEAATRTLQKPTIAKLDKFIWKMITDKMNDGQLDNCGLSVRDLKAVQRIFVQVLAGHFHTRIEYPGNGVE